MGRFDTSTVRAFIVSWPSQVSPYRCRYDYALPDVVDILHPSWSGLCLATCISTAFVVLQFLQARDPSKPIADKAGKQTHNNASGFAFPYGLLPHVVPPELQSQPAEAKARQVGDGLGAAVNKAVNAAKFLVSFWDLLRALGELVVSA